MNRTVLQTQDAPAAIGPYSQGVMAQGVLASGRVVFCSGQIPLDPRTGQLVTGDIQKETERVMENLRAVLKAADMDLRHVARCTIFLTDMNDFAKVNETYGKYFSEAPPARATVQVSALPKGARVEIDAIAIG